MRNTDVKLHLQNIMFLYRDEISEDVGVWGYQNAWPRVKQAIFGNEESDAEKHLLNKTVLATNRPQKVSFPLI